MIKKKFLRQLYEGRIADHPDNPIAGRLAFVREFHEILGVALDDGNRPTFPLHESTGQPYRPKNCARPDEVSLRILAESILGHDFVEEYYHPSGGFDFGNRRLLESAIDPSAFINISTFNLSVAGLVNAEIMERWTDPTHIGDQLCTVKPTNKNGDKLIGVQRIGTSTSAAKGRRAGEPHAEVGFGEHYQTTPETVEQALKVKITREAVYFDLTGQVLDEAGAVGDELSYGREKDILDGVLGVTNSHNYNGTAYNTYQTASPWINDHSNQLADYTSIDTALQLFVGMTDPDTGREINVQPKQILCAPAKAMLFAKVLSDTGVVEGTNLSAGNFPQRLSTGANPLDLLAPQLKSNLLYSPIAYNRCTAADGLNLSAANAKLYWWIGDFKKAFEWRENWPLTPWQANADELTMKDQGLVAVFGANYRGVFHSRQPRFAVRNKN